MAVKCLNCNLDNTSDSKFCKACGAQLNSTKEPDASVTKTLETLVEDMSRGTIFAGRYEIIESLGQGGMGKVYKAYDKQLKEEVALKLIRPKIASELRTVDRFRNELKIARKIVHKNVGRMYELMEDEGTFFITMEYVPGQDLKGLIRQSRQLTSGTALSITKQICEGLSEAHGLGVIHRDLKPSNIMIDKNGNARIMDFGIARSLKAEGKTGEGMMVGTPKYMSPEQVKGEELDQRSDIYSLGIVLFEMVTGKAPFKGDTSFSVALKHKTEKPPNPQDFNAQIPTELSRVILKCLEKEKANRCQSVEEVLSDLIKIEGKIPARERVFSKKMLKKREAKKRFQTLLVPGILLSVTVIIIAGYFFLNKILKFSETTWKSSIAVMPVEALSRQEDQEALSLGLQDDIITKLSSIEKLRVSPKFSVMKYKNMDKDIARIGMELKVDYILVLTLQKEHDKIRVNLRLRDAKHGFTVMTRSYNQDLDSYFKVQDEISKEIAQALEVQFAEDRFNATKAREPEKFEAYMYYRTGMYIIENKYHSSYKEEDFEAAKRMYKKAIEIEPSYALAYWGLGNAYEAHFNQEKDEEDYDSMLNYYNDAYQRNQDLAETNLGLGWIHFNKADNDEAYRFFEKALELGSNNSIVNIDIGAFLRSIGLYSSAIKYFAKAIELDPSQITSFHQIALCYMYTGKFKKAGNQLIKLIEKEPDNVLWRLCYVDQLIMMDKFDEAEKEITIAEGILPDSDEVQHYRAWIYAARGEREKALKLINGMTTYSYVSTCIYALLGMKDEAIDKIEEGILLGFLDIKEYLYSYPFLESNPCYGGLRHDPRFKEILRKEKKIYREKLKKFGKL